MFRVGDRVKPRDKGYGANRVGTVVEVSTIQGARVRVLWEEQANGVIAKRTWMRPDRLKPLDA